MVGKKSGKALKREEGLERTDNNLGLTSWPQISPINQKNYYTEYLKRDDQILALRLQNEQRLSGKVRDHKNRDRALAQENSGEAPPSPAPEVDMEDEEGEMEDPDTLNQPGFGSKTVVIHPGSQNLRIGLGGDALPKSLPMVVARKWKESESEEDGGEPRPKRIKSEEDSFEEPEKLLGEEFAKQFMAASAELKSRMRNNKRRVLPAPKELVLSYNKKVEAETIPEHNDPHRIEWTETPLGEKNAPDYITGHAALRIPDNSRPRYKLFWPLRQGWPNEKDYATKRLLYEDTVIILEEAIKSQLGLRRKKEWRQYDCVFVIPDLYERAYVTAMLEILMRELRFKRVCFIQESLAATFGAGYTSACVVDVGAQKTSICCVEDGMCVEDSRINLKYGGADVTELFIKMMLYDHFPYAEINLRRRYDFLLAEELKQKCCTMNEAEMSVQHYDFHLRVSGQDTRKYTFKTYDEVMLAAMGFFNPSMFENSSKLNGRRKLIDRSYDLYDNSPNDPVSTAQNEVYQKVAPFEHDESSMLLATNGETSAGTPSKERPQQAFNLMNRFGDNLDATPRSSKAGSRSPETVGTPLAGGDSGTPALNAEELNGALSQSSKVVRNEPLPIMPLDEAVLLSITHGARGDDKKTRDFLGGVMLTGGGSLTPSFHSFLEERLREIRPGYAKDIMIGSPPRELDGQVVMWKGGSVFGKLTQTNDTWINQTEWDRLGSRVLAYKTIWVW